MISTSCPPPSTASSLPFYEVHLAVFARWIAGPSFPLSHSACILPCSPPLLPNATVGVEELVLCLQRSVSHESSCVGECSFCCADVIVVSSRQRHTELKSHELLQKSLHQITSDRLPVYCRRSNTKTSFDTVCVAWTHRGLSAGRS